jgi:hypothetical protein
MASTTNFYQDIDIYGKEAREGMALEYSNQEAIRNALFLFLTSKRGDFIRNPFAGGLLDFQTFKTMSDSNIQKASFTIRNAINNYFSPAVEIQNINLIPDYTNRILEYNIIYKDSVTLEINTVSIYTDTEYKAQKFEYEDVPYVTQNLLRFIILQKTENSNRTLIYNSDDGLWYYGKFRLINFSPSDELFDDILATANT